MSPSARNPATWDEYEGRVSPSGSVSSTVLGEETALLDDGDDEPNRPRGRERRRYDNQPFPKYLSHLQR
jgi:vesicular inhibitory amino acid transporter